jgi:hypothetical protein
MVNKPRRKGTSAETALARYLRARGIPAERRPLAGIRDQGDLWACGGRVVIEVKVRAGGYPSPAEWARWHAQLDREVTNAALAGAPVDVGVLVVKRPGSGLVGGVGEWWARMSIVDWAWLSTRSEPGDLPLHLTIAGRAVQVDVDQAATAIAAAYTEDLP